MHSIAKVAAIMAVCLLNLTAAAPRIVKRSDDVSAYKAVVQQLTAKMASLEARLAADETKITSDEQRLARMEQQAAFRAQFSHSHMRTPASSPFKFDYVTLNQGYGYDPALGVFTAPYSGVYTFSFQFYTSAAERPMTDIKVNGQIASRMAIYTEGSDGSNNESTTSTIIVKLEQGDRVWVESAENTQQADIWGSVHTYFTGALIHSG